MLRTLLGLGLLVGFTSVLHAQPKGLDKLKSRTWKIGEDTREALVYIPANPDKKKLPLVFAFHGHGGTNTFLARRLAIHYEWPEAICIYPQGLPTPAPVIDPDGKRTGWQKSQGDQKDRDLEFCKAMLKTMKEEQTIDEARIYSTGHSNGGFFTYLLWGVWGDQLAAAAPIAAAATPANFKLLKPKPVLHIAGKGDKIVSFQSQELTMTALRKLNKCDAEGKPTGKDGTEYTSKNGPPVVCVIHSGGHEIPADAGKLITDFFKKQVSKQ